MDVYAYTAAGGHTENQDRLLYRHENGVLRAALCDGVGGMGGGAQAAGFCAPLLVSLMSEESPQALGAAVLEVHAAFTDRQSDLQLSKARSTAACLYAREGKALWATVGDTRAYHFRGGCMERVSPDDSLPYAAYERGEIPYADIRFFPGRSTLTAGLGDERPPLPHVESLDISPGDALLLCSDGFWQYVLEPEMEADLCVAVSARDWAERMLIRLTHRSMLAGDNFSLLAVRMEVSP